MEFLRLLLLFLHIIGLAVLLSGFFPQIGQAALRITPGMFHGALLQLITGMGLMGVREAEDLPVDNAKMGIKLVVLIAITVIVVLNRKKERVNVAPWLAVGLLTILNVGIAVFWT